MDSGFSVRVERSPIRIFDDSEYEAVGAQLVPEGSWVDAPLDHIIIGLKELPDDDFGLRHTHIQFAHCFKKQEGWEKVLGRFARGGGLLLDLEFLTDDSGRRVAAFGYQAGYAGAALSIKAWAWQLTHPPSVPLPGVQAYPKREQLIEDVRLQLANGAAVAGRKPTVLIIGALGRCGRGSIELCDHVGIPDENILKWDIAETARGGPFQQIVQADIFVNCIYLSEPISPFLDWELLGSPERNLRTVCDVSCDTTNPHNPIPIYSENSTFSAPTLPVDVCNEPPVTVISIDHLPSLLPRESSEAFGHSLLPSLLQLQDRANSGVWVQAERLYKDMLLTLPPNADRN